MAPVRRRAEAGDMDAPGPAGQAPRQRGCNLEFEGVGAMRDDEDNLPRPRPARLAPPKLDLWGVRELEEYIEELKAEIARVEAEIGRKGSARAAADAFFKRPG
jgi:uncharacterized small protein (DUF1192 family)